MELIDGTLTQYRLQPLADQFARGNELQQLIRENLKGIGYEL